MLLLLLLVSFCMTLFSAHTIDLKTNFFWSETRRETNMFLFCSLSLSLSLSSLIWNYPGWNRWIHIQSLTGRKSVKTLEFDNWHFTNWLKTRLCSKCISFAKNQKNYLSTFASCTEKHRRDSQVQTNIILICIVLLFTEITTLW